VGRYSLVFGDDLGKQCLVGWDSKAIRRGLLTFDVKEKLSFEMSQLLIRQQGVNVFSYATVRISSITLLFAPCDAFLYPFLLFIFYSFSFLLHSSLCCAIIILHVFSSSLSLSFLLSFIFFVISSKQITHRNLTNLPRIFQCGSVAEPCFSATTSFTMSGG
jgi:hypothetical protein